jgi:endonuclease I
MNKFLLSLATLAITFIAAAQQPYYNDVDLTLTGQDLYFELQNKIDISNNTFTYGDVRDSFLVTDEDTANSNNVLLIYGHTNDSNCTTDRSRDKDDFGGGNCEYNREHVFARGNADPDMGSASNGSTGIVADPHNLRPSDQQMNNNKGNKKFAAGSGNAGDVGSGNWYPGDEWRGDVARMMMYMYTRYGDRCLPSLNGVGSTQGSTDMLQVYLQWNAEDMVTPFEDQRNEFLETEYGNRNPFIDNPALATIIWGGPQAEDRWNTLSAENFEEDTIEVFPNPATDVVWVASKFPIESILLYDINGKEIIRTSSLDIVIRLDTSSITPGIYLLKTISNGILNTSKVIIN